MKRHAYPHGIARFGWALATLALAVAATLPASGAERVVLGELFTTLG